MESVEPMSPEAPDTRREMLSQQLDEVVAAAEPEVVEAKPARLRAEDGRFASEQVAVPEALVEDPVWKRAPASWKKEYHEAWTQADPRMQEYAYQREEQMRSGVEPLIVKAQFADQINEIVAPYLQTIHGLGIDAPRAIKALLEADHGLRFSNPQQKQQLFARLAQQYGVSFNDISGLPQQAVADPQIYALQNELNNVRGEVQGWKNQQEQTQNAALLGEINKFSVNAEHFEEARPVMIQLLQSGIAKTLEDAYDQAVRLSPTLYDAVQASKQAAVDSTKRLLADKAAKSARAAAVSVKSSTPGTPTSTKANDRRTMLSEQFDNMASRL